MAARGARAIELYRVGAAAVNGYCTVNICNVLAEMGMCVGGILRAVFD